jgi:ArsR family transcriptional regulator
MARSALPLLEPGDVLDIASGDGVLAELMAPHSRRYVCLDASSKVVSAASERLRRLANVEVREGDMHELPFDDDSFDLVVLMHALTYADRPAQAVAEAARVMRPGGRLLLTSLARHEHRSTVEAYGHVNLGFSEKDLRKFADKAGFEIVSCETVTRERRPPHFEMIALLGRKPGASGREGRSTTSKTAGRTASKTTSKTTGKN